MKNIPFHAAFSEYLHHRGLSAKTRQTIQKTISKLIAWAEGENIPIEQLSYSEMLAYISHCKQKGNSKKTQQQEVSNSNHYFKYLIEIGEREDNPASNIQIQGLTRQQLYDTLKPEELQAIWQGYVEKVPNSINGQHIHTRNKIVLALIIHQGIRPEEIGKLTVQDIQIREGKITIPGARRSNPRTLPLEGHQLYELIDYIHRIRPQIEQQSGKRSVQLIIGHGTKDHITNIMTQIIRSLTEQNPRVQSIKQIRASVITNWLKQHGLRKVQHMAGHRYVSSTESYQRNNIEALQDDITRYHPDL